VFCALSNGNSAIILATARGQGIQFKEEEVRSMGRQASGVMGIRVKKNDRVVGMEIVADHADVLFATEHGYGKKVSVKDFRVAHRGGMGVRTIPTDKRNGHVIGLVVVQEDSNILLIDQAGKIICLSAKDIRAMGRQAKGVRLIRLDATQKLNSVVVFEGGDDSSSNSPEETGIVIEKGVMPDTEVDSDDGEEESDESDQDEFLLDDEDDATENDEE
jgi:DNA gyrase subunit A